MVPVTNAVSGLTFKNRFCYLCNGGKHKDAVFWNVDLKCKTSSRFQFHYYPIANPFEFAKAAILDEAKSCNVVFDYGYPKTSLNVTPASCKVNSIIETCDKTLSDHVLQTLCLEYFWPVKTRQKNSIQLYRNYACMLCNGALFKEECPSLNAMETFSIVLTSFNDIVRQGQHYPSDENDQTDLPLQNQIIEQYFANNDQEVHCRQGFVYDSNKGTCRPVLCPIYFFVINGKCVPLFSEMKGVVYQVRLQADVPFSFTDVDVEQIETAIVSSLDRLLLNRIGKEEYELFIWKRNATFVQTDKYRQYLIILLALGSFEQSRYISFLRFIHNFVVLNQKLDISTDNLTTVLNISISIRFHPSIRLSNGFAPLVDDEFQLVKSKGLPSNRTLKHNGTTIVISQLNLCYRVSLLDHEVKRRGPSILVSGNLLHFPDFERLTYKQSYLELVCLHQILKDVLESTGYVFQVTDNKRYTFVASVNISNGIVVNGTYVSTGNTDNDTLFENSGGATIIAIMVASLVVAIWLLLARCPRKMIQPRLNKDTVTGIGSAPDVEREETNPEEKNLQTNDAK